MTTQTYKVLISCSNCFKEGMEMIVVQGKPVSNLTCPNCGVFAIKATLGSGWRKDSE